MDNTCGIGGSPAVKTVIVNNCGFSFTASPNPSAGDINITVQPQGASSANGNQIKIYVIRVIDQAGNVKNQFNYPDGVTMTNISLSNLVSGIYTIQAYNGSVWSAQQVVKQ